MAIRSSKIISLREAAASVSDGSTVAVGGLSYFGAPMSLIRELIRQRVRGLTLVTAAVTSLQADLLIAAGAVRKIIAPYVAFEELGLAPAFRRAVESGAIEVVECGEAFLGYGLKAGASGAPFYALPKAVAATDCGRVNGLYKPCRDPFTGEEVVCVPAIRPDIALLHVSTADQLGNLGCGRLRFMDALLARASKRVIATADYLTERLENDVSFPSFQVEAVVPLHGAARPTGSSGHYGVDRGEIKRYLSAFKNEGGVADYVASLGDDEPNYVGNLGAESSVTLAPPVKPKEDSAPPSRAEIMATVISQSVRDGMLTGAGTGCWEVAAGLRLAQMTHAPNLSFSYGGSGAVNPQLNYLPESLNGDEPLAHCDGVLSLEDVFDLEMSGRFDIMFASGMQIDQYGNVNLACVGPYAKPKLRGPGTVGLEFAGCVKEIVYFFRSHTKHSFVPKVDFVSAFGYGTGAGSRAEAGLAENCGPKLVVTNLAVMDFEKQTRKMRLRSMHPGVTVDQVKENTGFDLLIPHEIVPTTLPTDTELQLLRCEIDRGGRLRTLIPA
jgi:acyl CoA:acetate/3-ketoacid CoA transferase alpha subunit/acyl CoA:acetate/3-ketoacid CoA transferase beta subunit